ncbi:TlpA family protein disulfide reductase [Aureispira anguillae]|uniref:TlpA family protein disulfide reductase n=1 Tax=Aureispira anguillae TaxID=2864201 RepID=A0A915YD02_9BACT|nr:TlpA disulfide reductase family protein [Aureispira anguillae]BDS10820.1 TlpA family protein disulfide reductase [Aureispira anguillae]
MKKATFIITLNLLLVFVTFGQNDYKKSMEECRSLGYFESQECMIGEKIPLFEEVTYEGKKITPQSIKNKVVVINLWFMACAPCIAELDGLNKVVENYKKRKDVLFISFTTDSKQVLEEDFLPNYELNFEIIPNSEETIFNVFKNGWGFPTTIVVDKSGKIHKITAGGATDPEKASKKIEKILTQSINECLKN